MKKNIYSTLLLLLIYADAATASLGSSNLQMDRISRTVAYTLPAFHLNQLPLDTHISTNALRLYVEMLDPNRSFFLQEDINGFYAEAPKLHKKLRKGDVALAFAAYEVLIERMENRLAYTRELLASPFNLALNESYIWDRADEPWPADVAAWNELWRKKIKNEFIIRTITQTDESPLDTQTSDEAVAEETASQTDDSIDETLQLFLSPEEFIINRYEELLSTMQSFDEEMLLQRYLSAFSQVYDPHSDYLTPSGVEDFDINMKLSLVGIGAMLRPDEGAAKIVRIIPGGPAEIDGRLQPGDKIIAVAQGDEEPESILHLPLHKAVRKIRGEIDSKVVLTIIPAEDKSGTRTKKVELVRAEVKLEEQAAKSTLHEIESDSGETHKLGVITLPDFYADFKATQANEINARRASTDVKRLLKELEQEDIDGLIIDLRNNGGGSLVEAVDIAGLFITSGPIVQVKERKGIKILPDADPEINYKGPLIVLVNRLSASASEILAAALQDYKRAIIVGDEHTHGKGTVQTLLSLGERKGSLKLTTAGFYRINGGSTQLRGVEPDIVIPSLFDVMDIGEKEHEYALPWDTIRPALYRKAKGFDQYLPTLVKTSETRRAENVDFQVLQEQRAKLKERYLSNSVSLSLTEREADAAAEKELESLNLTAYEEEEDEGTDLLLDETLLILSDFIALQ